MVDILPALVCFPDGSRCEQYDLVLVISRYLMHCIVAREDRKVLAKLNILELDFTLNPIQSFVRICLDRRTPVA